MKKCTNIYIWWKFFYTQKVYKIFEQKTNLTKKFRNQALQNTTYFGDLDF